MLITGLVKALTAPRKAVRQQAHASLVQFGERSLPALQVALLGRSNAVRAAVARVLTDLVPVLSARARDRLLFEVVIAEALSAGHPSHPAVVNLLIVLRATGRALSCVQPLHGGAPDVQEQISCARP
jgi:hypothetical protein